MTTKTLDRALILATDYHALVRRGQYAEADQVARTIDDLVGTRRLTGGFWWPERVATAAGVTPLRTAK